MLRQHFVNVTNIDKVKITIATFEKDSRMLMCSNYYISYQYSIKLKSMTKNNETYPMNKNIFLTSESIFNL